MVAAQRNGTSGGWVLRNEMGTSGEMVAGATKWHFGEMLLQRKDFVECCWQRNPQTWSG
jgi:hypothetical protein